jgi:hypothetical protein
VNSIVADVGWLFVFVQPLVLILNPFLHAVVLVAALVGAIAAEVSIRADGSPPVVQVVEDSNCDADHMVVVQ